MNEIFEQLQTHRTMLALAIALIGLIVDFYGHRLFKVFIGLIGFCPGAIIGGLAASYLSDGDSMVIWIGAFSGGAVTALLAVALFLLGAFILGAVMGVVIANVTFAVMGMNAEPIFMFLAVIAGGVVGLLLQKLMIVFATALSGSWLFVVGGMMLVDENAQMVSMLGGNQLLAHTEGFFLSVIIGWMVLSAVGIFVQYRLIHVSRLAPEDDFTEDIEDDDYADDDEPSE